MTGIGYNAKTLADNNKSFIDSLIFWQDKPPPGVIICRVISRL